MAPRYTSCHQDFTTDSLLRRRVDDGSAPPAARGVLDPRRHIDDVGPTCGHSSSIRRQLVADVEQTAEQQLFGVLHVAVVAWTRLQTPDAQNNKHFKIRDFSILCHVVIHVSYIDYIVQVPKLFFSWLI